MFVLGNPLDLISGYCHSGCQGLYLYSLIHWHEVEGEHIPLCPMCIKLSKLLYLFYTHIITHSFIFNPSSVGISISKQSWMTTRVKREWYHQQRQLVLEFNLSTSIMPLSNSQRELCTIIANQALFLLGLKIEISNNYHPLYGFLSDNDGN